MDVAAWLLHTLFHIGRDSICITQMVFSAYIHPLHNIAIQCVVSVIKMAVFMIIAVV